MHRVEGSPFSDFVAEANIAIELVPRLALPNQIEHLLVQIDHFETVRQRKQGSLIWVSLTISPVKNAEGTIVGASKIARDITEHKRASDQIATLAREAEHRSKNLLASVQAMVNLSQADAVADIKTAISGRIQAIANVHSLFVATRWIGAELSTIAGRELAPYSTGGEKRVRIDGPQVLLEPDIAQAVP